MRPSLTEWLVAPLRALVTAAWRMEDAAIERLLRFTRERPDGTRELRTLELREVEPITRATVRAPTLGLIPQGTLELAAAEVHFEQVISTTSTDASGALALRGDLTRPGVRRSRRGPALSVQLGVRRAPPTEGARRLRQHLCQGS